MFGFQGFEIDCPVAPEGLDEAVKVYSELHRQGWNHRHVVESVIKAYLKYLAEQAMEGRVPR